MAVNNPLGTAVNADADGQIRSSSWRASKLDLEKFFIVVTLRSTGKNASLPQRHGVNESGDTNFCFKKFPSYSNAKTK